MGSTKFFVLLHQKQIFNNEPFLSHASPHLPGKVCFITDKSYFLAFRAIWRLLIRFDTYLQEIHILSNRYLYKAKLFSHFLKPDSWAYSSLITLKSHWSTNFFVLLHRKQAVNNELLLICNSLLLLFSMREVHAYFPIHFVLLFHLLSLGRITHLFCVSHLYFSTTSFTLRRITNQLSRFCHYGKCDSLPASFSMEKYKIS